MVVILLWWRYYCGDEMRREGGLKGGEVKVD